MYRGRIGNFNHRKSKQSGQNWDQSVLIDQPCRKEVHGQFQMTRKFLFLVLTLHFSLLGLLWLDNNNTPLCSTSYDTLDDSPFLGLSCTSYRNIMVLSTLTHSSVLAAQLLIGNIEANPGPMDTITYMADLIANVDDEKIR